MPGPYDANTADGIRLSLGEDYSHIYVYNLRGNQRTAGEISRKEGGKIFGGGSRNTVAIFIGVRTPKYTGPCKILYNDIGDYLSREQKLALIADNSLDAVEWQTIAPTIEGDWINQRDTKFGTWPALGNKKTSAAGPVYFTSYAYALLTARDAWVYNYSGPELKTTVETTIQFYNSELTRLKDSASAGMPIKAEISMDASRISWSSSLVTKLERSQRLEYVDSHMRIGIYRPFCRQHLYFDRDLNHRVVR
jgi:predicted helicase